MRSSFLNYRRALPLGAIFAAAAIASTVLFIVYAISWESIQNKLDGTEQLTDAAYTEFTKAKYSYFASVISLLFLIVFFNGYHLTKMT